MPNERRVRREPRLWAVLCTVLLVTVAVLLGVLGPRIGDGRSADSLKPLGDLAHAARDVQQCMEAEAIERPSDATGPTGDELTRLATESLRVEWSPPSFESLGGIAVLAGPIPLAGDGRGLAILFECAGENSARFVTLVAIPDDGGFAVFDEFGRARPFESSDAILEPDDPDDPDGPSTLVWTDGTILFVARCDERAALDTARVALGAP
ncbi:MAG: hypothetical protein EXS03_06520 [Phycisphaerales bacterium]|nr:hypothetical protein [Phycisphaerales bacterium]